MTLPLSRSLFSLCSPVGLSAFLTARSRLAVEQQLQAEEARIKAENEQRRQAEEAQSKAESDMAALKGLIELALERGQSMQVPMAMLQHIIYTHASHTPRAIKLPTLLF